LLGEIDELAEAIKRYPWTTLASMRGDQQVIRKIEEAEKLLRELKKSLG
jgi:ParB family chromosome partitioning protein